jgi:hypothetical protein
VAGREEHPVERPDDHDGAERPGGAPPQHRGDPQGRRHEHQQPVDDATLLGDPQVVQHDAGVRRGNALRRPDLSRCRGERRIRGSDVGDTGTVERVWATHQEALAVADNAARLPGAVSTPRC